MMSEIQHDWSNLALKQIRRDLTPFIDPGTKLETTVTGRTISACWYRNTIQMSANFSYSPYSEIKVNYQGTTNNYTSFLISVDMADLAGLAKSIERTAHQGLYVETQAYLPELETKDSTEAISLLQKTIDKDVSDRTHLIFVTADAGAGKTRTLRELVSRQSLAYLSGEVSHIYLYINAQGRALARFNEALATELQDLHAPFTYHAVAALVRTGSVIPIIDGFDELIGVSGYDDAFNSLAAFIEELNGEGVIIASARSSYYEEEFVERSQKSISESNQYWHQSTIRIREWGPEQRADFIEKYIKNKNTDYDDTEELKRKLEHTFRGKNSDLGAKPLFVERTTELLINGQNLDVEHQDLLDELVQVYLERERNEKLLDKTGEPLLSSTQIKTLMANLAEEMWNQEIREFDRRSVRDVAEYALAESGLPESSQQVLLERMPTLAFLTTGEREGSVAFEHETFFSYFLAWTLAGLFERGIAETRMLLSRSILPREVAERVSISEKLEIPKKINKDKIIHKLGETCKSAVARSALVQENAGLLAFFILTNEFSEKPISSKNLESFIFAGLDFKNSTWEKCVFTNIQFKRCDFSFTQFINCKGVGVILHEPIVDPSRTKLDIQGLKSESGILGIRVRRGETIQLEYQPKKIAETLIDIGLISDRDKTQERTINPDMLELLDRLMRVYRRANIICSDDDKLTDIFHSPRWPSLYDILIDNKILKLEKRPASGGPKDFYRRLYLPNQIMSGVYRDANLEPSLRQFWEELSTID